MQEAGGRCPEAEGGENQAGRNGRVLDFGIKIGYDIAASQRLSPKAPASAFSFSSKPSTGTLPTRLVDAQLLMQAILTRIKTRCYPTAHMCFRV
jgi:hypothetical protein